MSCGSSSKQAANAEEFGSIEEELKSKLGEDAYYTGLSVNYNESIGNMIGVTVTEEPESLKMGQWNLAQNVWTQNSEISLEFSEGSKAADCMFQLNDKINLSKLGELTEKSIIQLKEEKDLEPPTLNIAFVKFPDDGDMSEAGYVVMLKPKNGGTRFTFYSTLEGELTKMDY